MCPFSSEESARKSVRVLQIIVAALALGVLAFTFAILCVTGKEKVPSPDELLAANLVAYLAAGCSVMALGLRFAIGGSIAKGHRRRLANGAPAVAGMELGDRLLMTFQQKTIVERALVEGAIFFVLISFLIAGQWWSFGVAAVLLITLVFPFPTYDGAAEWVRQQLELIDLERGRTD